MELVKTEVDRIGKVIRDAGLKAQSVDSGTAQDMADKIRELGANGGVTAADLDGDFTRAEIEKHSAEAADLAKQLSRAA